MKRLVIIGGGICGAALARSLSRFQGLQVHLVEKAFDVGWGATKANTGIIHPGHEEDPDCHPLRARLCVAGNRLWHDWASELDISARWPGEIMMARNHQERAVLQRFHCLGERNGLTGMHIMEAEALQAMEPCLPPGVQAGLFVPSAGLIAPWEAVIALIENAVTNGIRLHLNTRITGFRIRREIVRGVQTTRGEIPADIIINAAGLWADDISAMAGIDEITLTPRRGEYMVFDKTKGPHPQTIMHFTPTQKSKGIYAVTTVEGNLLLGPTADDISPEEKTNRATTIEGQEQLWQHAAELLRSPPSKNAIIKTFAGLRPEPPRGQYIIRWYDEPWGFINVAGIRSPGLTAAPAIAQHVVQELLAPVVTMRLKPQNQWRATRQRRPTLAARSPSKPAMDIADNPSSERIVCRCNEVTEGAIVDAIHCVRQLGADTVSLDSIKFRTLAMFGHCQGSFCRTQIARIIARELGVPLWKVMLSDAETSYAIGDIKTLQSCPEVDL